MVGRGKAVGRLWTSGEGWSSKSGRHALWELVL